MLINKSNEIVNDPKLMADFLQEQFSSVYSDPNCPDIRSPKFVAPEITYPSYWREL